MSAVLEFPLRSREYHWSDEYLGIPFDECDCVTLCGRIANEIYGRKLELPETRPEPATPFAFSSLLQELMGRYVYRIPHYWTPREGDIVLMKYLGRLCHVGTYCVLRGDPTVVHAWMQHGSSIRTKMALLDRYRIAKEGIYRWRA